MLWSILNQRKVDPLHNLRIPASLVLTPNIPKKLLKPMTREGYVSVADEFNNLRNVERPKVVQGVADAAAEGDRSENAEYIYGKKRLREIDKRLRYLSGILEDVQVIDREKLSGDKVCFGASVIVKDQDSLDQRTYTLVGVGESDAKRGRISWQSPVGLALFGKKVGDDIVIEIPSGESYLQIVAIFFGDHQAGE